MNLRNLLASGILLACLPACGADAPSLDEGGIADFDPALDASLEASEGKDDALSTTSTFYTMRRDLRRCAAPACGGFYVARVNATTTRCHDGVSRRECYVAGRDLSPLLLDQATLEAFESQLDAGRAVVRGTIGRNPLYRALGRFQASEGYTPATTAAATGTFYRAQDNGRLCIAAPCPDVHVAVLNSTRSGEVAGVQLTGVTEKNPLLDAAMDALASDGLLLAGTTRTVTGPAGRALTIDASQFFLRVRPVATVPVERACGGFVGGQCDEGEYCDVTIAQACGGADLPGVCLRTDRTCTALQPVCGCDGRTYASDCERVAAGVQKDRDGAC